MNLEKKVVVITGASSGIGKALALEAIQQKALLAVCSRHESQLRSIFQFVPEDQILMKSCDVSQEAEVKRFIEQTLSKFGKIDILINNAGLSMRALFQDMNLDVMTRLMNVNFMGTVYATKYALPSILKTQGTVVGVSSIAGYRGLPARTAYSASKFAMQGFLESLRTELLYTGVNVMWVCPGFTASNIRNAALNSHGEAQSETPLDEKSLMSSEEVSHLIWSAIDRRKRTLVMTAQGKLTVWMSKLFPKWTDKLIYNHFAKEPDSPLQSH